MNKVYDRNGKLHKLAARVETLVETCERQGARKESLETEVRSLRDELEYLRERVEFRHNDGWEEEEDCF